MIIAFFSGLDIAGAFAIAFRFEMFVFVAIAFESYINFIRFFAALLTSATLITQIVESFSDCPVFAAASKAVWIRPPRKPPDKFRISISRRVCFLVDC